MKIIWNKIMLLAVSVSFTLAAGNLSAAPIIGDFGIIGFGVTYRDAKDGNEVGIGEANYLDFGSTVFAGGATGDFVPHIPAAVGEMIPAFISDFSINPFAVGGIQPLLQVGGFEFALNTLSIDLQNDSFLNLSGYGVISGNGFDATSGYWQYSSQSIGFTFSAGVQSAAVPVPEQSSILLVGIGLLGLAIRGFKLRRAAA